MPVRVGTLRGEIQLVGFFAARRDLRRNSFLDGHFYFITRVVTSSSGNFVATMLVALAKVAFGNRDLAMRTIAKLDSSVATRIVRADELLTMLDVFWDDKVSRL